MTVTFISHVITVCDMCNIISFTNVQKYIQTDKQQTNAVSFRFSRLGVLHRLESSPLSNVLQFTRRSYLCRSGATGSVCDNRRVPSLPA